MAIDIKELRRLAQAALAGPDGVSLDWIKRLQDFQHSANPAAISELLDQLEEAEEGRDELRVVAVREADRADAHQVEIFALRTRIETLEKEYQHALELKEMFQHQLNETEEERNSLRAVIYDDPENANIVRLRLRLELDAARNEVQHLRGCISRLLRYANLLPDRITSKSFSGKNKMTIEVPARAYATASKIAQQYNLERVNVTDE